MSKLFLVKFYNKYIQNNNSILVRSAVNLAYKLHGKKLSEKGDPPVLVLHGLLGSKKNWQTMSTKIARNTQRPVVAVDARNHGESPHDNSHTYFDLASDVSLLMNKLSIVQATIIGHSMGGRTAMVLALTEPSKVESLIVVDISPVSTAGILNKFFLRLIDVMKTVDFKGTNNVTNARKIAKDKIAASGVIENVENMSFIFMAIDAKPDNTIGWIQNLDVLVKHFADIASFPSEMTGKQYHGPTLFMGGKQSPYIPPEDLAGIKKFFPKGELKYISGVGHNIHAEDPPAFLKMVTEFISKI